MPPERVPYDRKDSVFKGERKFQEEGHPDVLDSTFGGGSNTFSTPRLRDQYHSLSPRLPVSGPHNHLLVDDPGSNGFNPSLSDGSGFRSPLVRYGNDINRNDSLKEDSRLLKQSPLNSGDPARYPHDSVATSIVQRSVADLTSSASASPTSSCQPTYLKEHHNKTSGGVNDSIAGPADDKDRDHLLGLISWKKWSRSGSFSSSTKPISRSHLDGVELESVGVPGSETPTQVSLTSPSLLDDINPRKKQRLGWGQGLAKYEKQKVEGPDDSSGKDSVAHGGSRFTSTLSDSSPKMGAVSCASPTTPTSITCSSSRGPFDTVNNETTSLCDSPFHEHQRSPEGFSLELNNPNGDTLLGLNFFISELLQPEEFCSGDSNFTMQTALNKLLLLKADILKEVEKTEGEIDYIEHELRTINVDRTRHSDKSCVDYPNSSMQELTSGSIVVSNNCQFNCCSSEDFAIKIKDVQCIGQVVATSKSVRHALANRQSSEIISHKDTTGIEELETPAVFSIEPDIICTRPFACLADGSEALSCTKSVETSLDDEAYFTIVSQITDSNRESARKASETLGNCSLFTSPIFDGKYLSKSIPLKIKGKLSARKRILKFKERALVLKYRAFLLLWKEDLRLLTLWKHHQRSRKRCDSNCRSFQNSFQRSRSSLHFSLPAECHSSLVPTREIIDFTGKMILHDKIKVRRTHLKMPALVLDERERKQSVFLSTNGLIIDPFVIEKEKLLINPWTEEERIVFLEKLESCGKNFTKIASFLKHKTTADCVEFYYKNHRSDSFYAVKKILKLRKQEQALPSNKYMVASGKKWKEQSVVGPLDMLGEISSIIAYSNINKSWQKHAGKSVLKCAQDSKINRSVDTKDSSADCNAKTTAIDLLAGIGNSVASEGMDSCITSSANHGEKVDLVRGEHPLFPEVSMINDEEDTCSDEGFTGPESVDWTDKEKTLFINALRLYGKDFSQISDVIRTRSEEQCKIFFSKARKCLSLDAIYRGSSNCKIMPSNDASIANIDPSTCVGQSKVNDFMHPTLEKGSQESRQVINSFYQTCSNEKSGVLKQEVDAETIKTTFLPCVSDAKISIRCATQQLKMDLEEKHFISTRNNNSEKNCDMDNTIMENNKMSQMPSATISDSNLILQSDPPTSHAAQQIKVSCAFSDTVYNRNKKGEGLMKCHLSVKQKDDKASPLGKHSSSEIPCQRLEDNTNIAQHSSLFIRDPNCRVAHQNILANQLLPQGYLSRQILEGYPLHLLNMKGNMDALKVYQKLVCLDNYSEKSGNQDVLPVAPIVQGEEYDNCKHEKLDRCHLLIPKYNGSSDPKLNVHSLDNESETAEQSGRTCDIKLFGKILSHPHHTTRSSDVEDKSPAKSNTSSLKLDSLPVSKDFHPSESENIPNTSNDDIPLRTYGFWDGKRIQTGFTSLPESAIILSKYSGGFPGVSYHSTNECIGPNSFRSHQCSFPDNKKQPNVYHEMQKNSDTLSGIQQRGRVAMNLVGGGNSVDGMMTFSSVSDPVAAMKMHYASQSGLLGKDKDSWRTDTGGR